MKLPNIVETKLRDPEAIVLPRVTPGEKRRNGYLLSLRWQIDRGETTFPYSATAYADWLRSMADALTRAA